MDGVFIDRFASETKMGEIPHIVALMEAYLHTEQCNTDSLYKGCKVRLRFSYYFVLVVGEI